MSAAVAMGWLRVAIEIGAVAAPNDAKQCILTADVVQHASKHAAQMCSRAVVGSHVVHQLHLFQLVFKTQVPLQVITWISICLAKSFSGLEGFKMLSSISARPRLPDLVSIVSAGVPVSQQMRDVSRGADIVVGTPGRIMDLQARGALDLSAVDFAILDEADQMLDIGFADDVEKILSEAPAERQTMLFSATMPTWVKKLTRKHQRDPLVVDLVGDEEAGKMAESIK